MTTGELEGLYYLPKEIALYDLRLAALDREQKTIRLQGAARQQWNAGAEEYRQSMIENRERRKQELSILLKFIDDIPDPFIRAIFTARFTENKTWWETAYSTEQYGHYTMASARQACYRYLEKYNEETGAA